MEATADFVVESPDVVYSPDTIEAQYDYRTACVSREGSVLKVGKGPRDPGWTVGAGRTREPGADGNYPMSKTLLG